MWVTVTARSSKVIRLVLPSVSVRDTRPGVQAERALVLTTSHVVDNFEQVRLAWLLACLVWIERRTGAYDHLWGGQCRAGASDTSLLTNVYVVS